MDREVVLRRYLPADLDALYAMDVACFEAPFRFSRSMMRRFAEAAKARVVVAAAGPKIVGFCIVHVEREESGRVGYVVTLDVEEDYRRTGIAAMLMEEAERQCAASGCAAMVLHVFVGNAAALRFYERCGYERTSAEPGFYGVGLAAEVWLKRLS
jgi:ribosomal-protein-alanine N-acetyltransferase